MKVADILGEQTLQVVADDPKQTTLVDPKTKIQTLIPKDPNKPGMITKDPTSNKFVVNTQQSGEVDQTIKPGEQVEVAAMEKAVSRKQQRFMGMVHAAQKGEQPASGEVAKVASNMKKKDAKDFASTKHKGLPEEK
jgi:hypothetical protein